MVAKQWRCSQCGTVNEPGARACRECGKWPSLFDLQDPVTEEVEPDVARGEVFEPEVFEPEVFEPEAEEEAAEDEAAEGKRLGRFPRWVVTAIWVTGLLFWIVVNTLADRG
jgi:predicted ATP-dependent serine protease